MSLPGVGETRVLDASQIDILNVYPMCARRCASAVPVKIAIADRDRCSRYTTKDTRF
jgi:hypothetical protein